MALLSDARMVTGRFAPYIEELHGFYACYDMPYGSPEDLFELSRGLNAPGTFRGEFSSMIRSVILREGGQLPHTELLTLVAVSIGGLLVADADEQLARQIQQPIEELMDFLIGVHRNRWGDPDFAEPDRRIHVVTPRQLYAASQPEPAPPPSPCEPAQQATTDWAPFAESIEPNQTNQRHEAIHAIEPNEAIPTNEPITAHESPPTLPHPLVTPTPLDDSGPETITASASALREALLRLELSNLEVKHYLDSIEERISRIEPQLERTSAAAPPRPAAREPHPFADTTESLYSRLHAPLPLEDLPATEAAPQPPEGDEEGRAAMSAERPASRFMPPALPRHGYHVDLAVILLLLTAAALVVWRSTRVDPQVASSVVRQSRPLSLSDASSPQSAPRYILNASSPGTVSARSGSAPSNGSAAVSVPIHRGTRPAASEDADAGAGLIAPPTASYAPELHPGSHAPAGASAATGSARPATSPALNAATSNAGATDEPTDRPPPRRIAADALPGSPQDIVHVASGIMASHLLSSSPPDYPRLASLAHIHGQVTLQAVISKNGEVASLEVLNGPRMLRGAAIDAVRKWQYRPYLIDGHPVDVATLVNVDFKPAH